MCFILLIVKENDNYNIHKKFQVYSCNIFGHDHTCHSNPLLSLSSKIRSRALSFIPSIDPHVESLICFEGDIYYVQHYKSNFKMSHI